MAKFLQDQYLKAMLDLRQRVKSKSSSLAEIQRMYGFCLGMRVALMEARRQAGENPYTFAGYTAIRTLMESDFGQMSRSEMQEFNFPEI